MCEVKYQWYSFKIGHPLPIKRSHFDMGIETCFFLYDLLLEIPPTAKKLGPKDICKHKDGFWAEISKVLTTT